VINKAKEELDKKLSHKLVALGEFNLTIWLKSNSTNESWDPILGSNNSDKIQTNDN